MCNSGAYRQTRSSGLYPSSNVVSLSSCAWGVMLDPALGRVKIPGNHGIPGSVAVATTPSMVSLVSVTCARVGEGRKLGVLHAWVGAKGKSGVPSVWGTSGGTVGFPCILVPV